tara:strand:+ start:10021 stop:10992 length:972 start_codon:yes stop_codon:yes gene_type:complete
MKQFLRKIFKNLQILILLIFVIKILPKEYIMSSNLEFVKQLDTHNKMIDVSKSEINLVIGDSRAEFGLIDPKSSFMNLSLGGSTPFDGYLTVKKVLNQGTKIDSVIISYGPLLVHTQLTYFSRTKYYDLFNDEFSKKEIEILEKIEDPVYKDSHGFIHSSIPENLYPIYFSILDFTTAITGLPYSAMNKIINLTKPLEDKINKNPYCISPEIARSGSYKNSLANSIYLKKLKKLLDENQIKYFFVYTPLIKTSKLPQLISYWDYYYDKTKILNPINTRTPFLNHDLFRDCAHLNFKGAKIFSDKIFKILRTTKKQTETKNAIL